MAKQGFAVAILMFAVPGVFATDGIDFEIGWLIVLLSL